MLNVEPRYIGGRDGKRLRTAIFDAAPAAPRRGVCALFNGQTEFIEKYGEVIGELTARGFAVATLDWRGQGGSLRALADPLKVHIGDFAEYDEDLAAFMDMVVRPLGAGPPVALAHSMGGHVLLRALSAHPGQFAAAVFSAPMIAMQVGPYPWAAARGLCWLQNALGKGEDYVLGLAGRDPQTMTFAEQRVTSDPARYARAQAMVRAMPDLRTGAPTWGWLEASFRSIRAQNVRGYAEKIATPVLIVGAGRDRIVRTAPTEAFARRIPGARYLCLGDSEHEILMEADPIRARFWEAFDGFVGKIV